jgi:hypothetical protein
MLLISYKIHKVPKKELAIGAFDWLISKNNNHTINPPKLKYYLAFFFNGLASYINKKNITLVKGYGIRR